MLTLEQFQAAAESHNMVPLVHTVLADLYTPVSLYLAYRTGKRNSFLLESVEPNERVGRFSFLGGDPLVKIIARNGVVEVHSQTRIETFHSTIIEVLKQMSSQYKQYPVPELEGFSGGFLGYVGYDCVSQFERIPLQQGSSLQPDAMFGLFQSVIKFDHRKHLITLIHNVFVDQSKPLQQQYLKGKNILDEMLKQLQIGSCTQEKFQCEFPDFSDRDESAYCKIVERAKRYIYEGDIFQVVLSRKDAFPFSGDPFPVYRALRLINPSPYLFYLDFDSVKLIGSSPEILVRVEQGHVEVFPIAGTRKRGATIEEDLQLEQELLADEKELAEHNMLIDLGRNDVGRISEIGSVHVPVNKRVDHYSHVMHIVSEVHGKLRSDCSSIDALQACFPAGTVTGAPKVRAMEIISELETERRGIYAGAVGYVGFDGTLDMCIAIRTIIAVDGNLYIQAGAGIVADSVPEREYRETCEKSGALLDAIRFASRDFKDHVLNAQRGAA